MNIAEKKKIVKSSITQAGVPVLFDEIMNESEIHIEPVQLTVTENKTVVVKAEDVDREEREAQGLPLYAGVAQVEVTVDTPSAANIQENKSVEYTENGEFTVSPDEGYDAVASVSVTVDTPVTNIQENKSVEYTENGEFTVSPDEGYDAVASVSVTVDVTSGPVTPVNPGPVDTLAELADYAKSCNTFGAVLSMDYNDPEEMDPSDVKYVIWNDDPDNQSWDPRAISTPAVEPTGHDGNVAVCIGDGRWMLLRCIWNGIDNNLAYAAFTDHANPIYDTFLDRCVAGSGKDNTDYILNNFDISEEDDPLWEAISLARQELNFSGAYIPNLPETIDILVKLADPADDNMEFLSYNSNIGHLFSIGSNIGSSTQGCMSSDPTAIYAIYIGDGFSFNFEQKDSEMRYFACLDFSTPSNQNSQDEGIGVSDAK